jgi:hypothetical protein
MLAGLTSGFQRNGALADKLKADTVKVTQFCIYVPLVPHMATTVCSFVESQIIHDLCETICSSNARFSW